MDAEPLSYTAHPAQQRVRLEPAGVTVAQAAKAAPKSTVAALTGSAVVGLSLAVGLAGLSMNVAERESAPKAEKPAVFEKRPEASVPAPFTPPPAGQIEARETSPLPVVGEALNYTPAEYAAAQARVQAEEDARNAATQQAQRPMAYHSLTSFSGNVTVSIGQMGQGGGDPAQTAPSGPQRWSPPPPAQWNRPVEWIDTHESRLNIPQLRPR